MVELYIDELKNEREWETFLQAAPEGTFFQSLKWKEVLQKSYPFSALYLTIKDENGRLVGVCPGFIVRLMGNKVFCSMPYSDYGGPVIKRKYDNQASLSLHKFLLSLYSTIDVSYVKICFIDKKLSHPFKSRSSRIETYKGISEIDLKVHSSDFIWNKILSKNRRYKIKRCERDGYQAYEARTISDLREFYKLYFENMKYIGALPYRYEFIENMWRLLYPENLRIWFVGKEKIIGGILVFKYGQKTYWSSAGIDRNHRNINKYSVISYLIWKEIKKAEEEGYRYANLGSTSSDSNDSNHLQKKRLGGSFFQQEVVWYPLNVTGHFLLHIRGKTVSVWRSIRNVLPNKFRYIIEHNLSKL